MSVVLGKRPVSDTWLTPPNIINALGAFDVDPCCPPAMPWRTATTMYTEDDDGLAHEWEGRVWLNPPYSEPVVWLDRLATHGDGVALVFARTETKWFHEHVWDRADGVMFLRGRIRFHDDQGVRRQKTAPAPSVLVAYGLDNVDAMRNSGLDGVVR